MKYEVFLSFRGPDTRDNFVSCLFCDMKDIEICVFKDDENLRVGEKIEGELLQALNDSQIYIPIFSKGFATSSWCLREVAHMRDCTSKSDGKKEILPVFFDVTPNDVKCRTNLYRDALPEHEKKYGSLEVKRWRDALVEVATTVGWKLEGQGHGVLIKQIVREVLLKLDGKNRHLPNHLVETDDLKHIEKSLDVDSNDHVRFVVIHGTGGIGKSTLASIIFNRFRSKFNCSSFLEDVQSHHPLEMQKKLLAETQGANFAQEIYDTNTGIDRIKKGLCKKKVLIVVDNVDEKKQLENLAGSCDWFGFGSRIIVTLRDLGTIQNEDYQTQPSNYMYYPVKEMPFDQAIQLFSKYAFRSDTRPNDWYKFSEEVVSSVGRLPLTLQVVGSSFAITVKSEWRDTLEDLKQAPDKRVRDTLMISINKLDKIEKAIFLDIACFCIGEDKTYAEYMWGTGSNSPRRTINLLLHMSLIKIGEENRFWMHDEVRDLGRYIVKEENSKDPGKRRWVRIDENTEDILRSKKEKGAVQALSLCASREITPDEIACLPELWFLGGKGLTFVGDFENCLRSLRWLSWLCCSLDFSATNLYLENLVVLNLSRSKITDDWGGWRQIQAAKLRILDLTECHELTKTPNFSKFGKLDKLILSNCRKLSTIDSSIGKLELLETLDIRGCRSLQRLPEEIGSLKYLSKIIMPYFYKVAYRNMDTCHANFYPGENQPGIKQLPHSIGRLNLTHLDLFFCKNLCELPDSIGELKLLVELNLGITGICSLPSSIRKLKNLKYLFLHRCNGLLELPHSLGELESLVILESSYLKISVLPDSIGRLVSLTHLSFCFCKNLRKLPDSIGELESLVKLDLEGSGISVIPNSIGRLKNLKYLLLSNCRDLQALPNSIGDLESLLNLDVTISRISILPDSIGRLTNLMHLGYPWSSVMTAPSLECSRPYLGCAHRFARLDASNSASLLRLAALECLYKPSVDSLYKPTIAPFQRRERARQRDMEMEPPTPRQLPEPAVPIFTEGVALTLSGWLALQMTVDNEWDGRSLRQWADELSHDVFTWFTQSKEPLYINDLEDLLYEAMIALNTVALDKDDTVEEVAEKLVIMHGECLEGNFAAVEKLREAALKRVAPAHVKQVVEGEEEEDSDCEDMTVDDSPYMVVDAPKSQPSPTPANQARDEGRPTQAADADGWTVVRSRKSKGKK